MRNGSVPTRILQLARRRNTVVVRSADFVDGQRSPQAVSRAMRRLVAENWLEPIGHGVYRLLTNDPPTLAFNRAWSAPGGCLSAETVIATTLARPTLRDVARLCKAYGVHRVRLVLASMAAANDIPDELAKDWQHRLDNIERGFRNAVARLPAQ